MLCITVPFLISFRFLLLVPRMNIIDKTIVNKVHHLMCSKAEVCSTDSTDSWRFVVLLRSLDSVVDL